jgi:3-hydroxyacyl-CoA dehydrogenase/enoyl-CoA hydratase/3-hydroxybutyryl-CoA epimerase
MSDDPSAKIGLPEVMLGVIPGMGGCVRLPNRVGIANALELILQSKQLNGERAYKMGLIDAVIPKENFEEMTATWIRKNIKALKSETRLSKEPKLGGVGGFMGSMLEKTPMGRSVIFNKARSGVMEKTRGQYPAPLEVIDVISDTGTGYSPKKVRGAAREQMLKREAQGFGKMAATAVSKNLIRLFFMTEEIKKQNGLDPGKEVTSVPVKTGGILGAGVMGGGIAQLFAQKDIPSRMKDVNMKGLEIGFGAITKLFLKQVKTKKLNSRQYQQKLNLIQGCLDFSGFNSVDVVVEAVVENMDIKKKVFAELENHISETCVVASNTSSLSINEMQKAFKRPERFVGMHFFNPVHKMPLIEVIRGEKSSDEAVSRVFQLSKRLGKYPVVVKDGPGFLVNRLLAPYLNEATWLLAQGCPIPEIDNALLNFGMPMGPIELIDEVGVDVGEKVGHILHTAFGARMLPANLNTPIIKAGRLGKKSGKGIYEYEGPKLKKTLNNEIYSLLGVTPESGKFSKEEIVERCVLPIINEAARCLEEKIVFSPSEVDLGMIMGTGFAPFRGGPLRYADSIGIKTIVTTLEKYEKSFSERFKPSGPLKQMALNNQTFYRD